MSFAITRPRRHCAHVLRALHYCRNVCSLLLPLFCCLLGETVLIGDCRSMASNDVVSDKSSIWGHWKEEVVAYWDSIPSFAWRDSVKQQKPSVFVNGLVDEIRCRHLVVMNVERCCQQHEPVSMLLCVYVKSAGSEFIHINLFSPSVRPSALVCMCVYVCIYVCMYICMYVRMYVCMCIILVYTESSTANRTQGGSRVPCGQTDGQKNTAKLMVTFRNFTNKLKNGYIID
jgi:hypothetical protein